MDDELRCRYCHRLFARREHLIRHVQTHTNERPFECSKCHATFARIDALSRHFNARHSDDGTQHSHSAPLQKVQMACVQCGRAKVRCTGTQPCQRCATNSIDCHYDHNRRASKGKRHQQQKQQMQQNQQIQPSQPIQQPLQQIQQIQPQNQVQSPDQNQAQQQNNVELRDQTHNQQSHGSLEQTSSNVYGASTSGNISSTNILPDAGFMVDQASLEFANGVAALGTPSSMPNHDIMMDNQQQQGFLMPSTVMSEFCIPPEFDRGFDITFGNTMPAFSGIEWAMIDYSPNASGFTPNFNPNHEELQIIQENEARPPTDDSETELEPRQFKITTISRDAPLRFPDMGEVNVDSFDDEDRAHVTAIEDGFFNPLFDLVSRLQVEPFHPPFERLIFPPDPVMNIFIQLYFEHFHALVPILHKPTFSASTSHWLLVFTVATIGCRYSKIPNAKDCSLAMLELVRRVSSSMCETDNKRSRDIWMIQVILLCNMAMMYSGDPRMIEIAELKQSLPVSMSRRKRIFENTSQGTYLDNPQLSHSEKWKIWRAVEERRRLAAAVWIHDSNHGLFLNLTPTMTIEEFRCSLPCSEALWESPTAQAWATQNIGSRTLNLKTIFESNSMLSYWPNIGYLAKQIAIHHVFRTCQDYKRLILLQAPQYRSALVTQREKFLELLDAIYEEETQTEIGGWSPSTAVSIRLLIHLVRMVIHAPFPELPNWVFRRVSGVSWQNDAQSTTKWMIDFPCDCRTAVLHAGQAYALIRDTNCNGFTDSVVLLYSTFVFWAFTEQSVAESHLSPGSQTQSASSEGGNGSLTLFLDGKYSLSDLQQFVKYGAQLYKVRGVGTITTRNGRARLLDVLIELMGRQEVWDISKLYRRILVRLAALGDGNNLEEKSNT